MRPVTPVEPPDTHHLSAAIGWLELGNPAEARFELSRVSLACQQHPDVLEVHWLICAEQKEWEEGLRVARSLIEKAPDRCSGWLHQAYALRRVPNGGVPQAWRALQPAAEAFPNESIIPYNLACYACQMGHLDTARDFIRRALRLGDKAHQEHVRQMALQDPDLEALWGEIPQI